MRSPSAVLDGEVCALDEAGRSDFGLLQRGEGTLVFVAFDVLERDGEPLVDQHLRTSGAASLEDVLDAAVGGVLLSPSFDDGAALEAAAHEHGLEGVVAKRRGSTYHPGRRSPDWRKLKLKHRQELVIAGYTRGKGRRSSGIGSLILGVHGRAGFAYAGNVGTGLTDAELDRLERLLAPLVRAGLTVRRGAAPAPRPSRGRDLGRADARRRDRVRRVDEGRPPPRARLRRSA